MEKAGKAGRADFKAAISGDFKLLSSAAWHRQHIHQNLRILSTLHLLTPPLATPLCVLPAAAC